MKKIIISLFLIVLGSSLMYAGTWVVGVNQIDGLLSKLEQGTGEAPPVVPRNAEGGYDTDLEDWEVMPGITLTEGDITTDYLNHADANNHWRGITGINYADMGYVQTAGTVIEIVQPSLVEFDYDGPPEGYANLTDYFDRNDLSWLENINLSGNRIHSLVIDASLYGTMPLKVVNLANNPTLTSLSVLNCKVLETLDLSNTGISPETFAEIEAAVHEASPTANIIYNQTSVNTVDSDAPAVNVIDRTLYISNKTAQDKVFVFDLFGRMLIDSNESVIDLSNYTNGVYLVKINNNVTKILNR